MSTVLTAALTETIQSAARRLTSWRRREFQAEMALKYCEGNARRAERLFGWGRNAVHTGLNEFRTGIRCRENFSARGRQKSEVKNPALVAQTHALVEPESQADPKFQTPLAFTRLPAKAVQQQLATGGSPAPAQRTVRDLLNRLGYRLRRVRKSKPQKHSARPTRSSTTCGKSTRRPPARRKRCGFRSIPRPKSRSATSHAAASHADGRPFALPTTTCIPMPSSRRPAFWKSMAIH